MIWKIPKHGNKPECPKDLSNLGITQSAHFSLSKHNTQLLILKFCGALAGIGVSLRTHRGSGCVQRQRDRQILKLK